MSSYNKQKRFALAAPVNGEKKVLKALISSELNNPSVNAEAHFCDLKASLTVNKHHSSATLLRKKLKGHLVRDLQEI